MLKNLLLLLSLIILPQIAFSGQKVTGSLQVTGLPSCNFIKSDSTGLTACQTTTGYGLPAGSTTQIQYNNAGVFGGTSGLTWDGTNLKFGSTQAVYFNNSSTEKIYSSVANQLDITAASAVVIGQPGDIILGSNSLYVMYPQTDNMIDLGTASFRYNDFYVGKVTITEAKNIVLGTTTGTKIGTATSQKLGFFNATPIVQVVNTTDLGTVLSNLGLRAAGTAYPITTSGAVSFTGTIGLGGQITVTDAKDFALGTTTGSKFGTATSQRIGFYNSTPVVQGLATTDLGTILSNLGLRAAGTAYPITTTGAVTLGSLTSGRVPVAGASGLLGDDADMTFATDTLTVTKIVVGAGASVGKLDHGTYTPTLTNTTNIDASTARLATWSRVGNTVTVGGQLDIDPTLTASATLLGISLPVASALTTAYQLGGTANATGIAGMSGGIEADDTNDRASLKFVSTDITNQTMTYTFTYQVL